MADENPTEGDWFNYGLYLWFTGKIDDAANCFRAYKKKTRNPDYVTPDVHTLIRKEQYLLDKNGIIEEEITLMFDLIDA
jgi:hypothetical protein